MKLERRGFLKLAGAAGLALLAGCKAGSSSGPTLTPQPSLYPIKTSAATEGPTRTIQPRPVATEQPFITETPKTGGIRLAFPPHFISEDEIPSDYQRELTQEEIIRLYDSEGNVVDFGYYGQWRPYEQEGQGHPNYYLTHLFVSGFSRGVFQDLRNGHFWVVLEIPLDSGRQIMLANVPNQTDNFTNLRAVPDSRNIEESRRALHSWADVAAALGKPQAIGNQLIWGFQIEPENDMAGRFAESIRMGIAIDLNFDQIVGTSFAWIDESLFG